MKIIELVTTDALLEEEAKQETLVMEDFIVELDDMIDKYIGVLHVHDLLAILVNTQLSIQLGHCIDMGDE